MSVRMRFEIGVDVGGTFTDVVVRAADGRIIDAKAPTTPADQSEGVLEGLRRAANRLHLDLHALLAATDRLVHGTTVATNALLEGKGAPVGMLTTEGHRDVIAMHEGLKPERYNLRMKPPAPLVPRELRLPVRERMRADGRVETPLDPHSLDDALNVLAQADVQAVAICFLHSWRNPLHEQQAETAVRRRLPHAYVTISSDVLPEIKEYERFSTTIANAMVGPVVRAYLHRLAERLKEAGLRQPPFVMLSHGGIATVEEAVRLAAGTALSGPAGGVAASQALAEQGAGRDMITFDMGGTSTDIALVRDGGVSLSSARGVGDVRIALPSLDIVTLGAGGGSIAALNAAGLLRVGPESAGAVPGPVCYGRGGKEPAVTDANLVLGYLSTEAVLDGGRQLDLPAARAALARLGERLGLDEVTAAAGIHRLVNARMADGVRIATVRRGVDPRRFALLSFGGAAGLHICAVAAELGISRAVVPVHASVLSAWGMLNTDPRVQQARSFGQEHGIDVAALADAYAQMEREGRERLAWFDGPLQVARTADIRYGEQIFEIPVSLDGIDLGDPEAADHIRQAFHRRHEALFTYALPDQDVVLVNARIAVTGRLPVTAPLRDAARQAAITTRHRRIHIGGWIDAPVWRFEALADGQEIAGPALIDSDTTTILLRPGDRAAYDGRGWLMIAVAPQAAQESAGGDRA